QPTKRPSVESTRLPRTRKRLHATVATAVARREARKGSSRVDKAPYSSRRRESPQSDFEDLRGAAAAPLGLAKRLAAPASCFRSSRRSGRAPEEAERGPHGGAAAALASEPWHAP